LSKRFASRSLRFGCGLAAVGVVLLLAACGASTPRQAEVGSPETVVPGETAQPATPAAQTAAPAGEAAAPAAQTAAPAASTDERRHGRKASKADEASASAEATEPAPVPEAAQQSYDRALAAMRSEDWLSAQVELEQLAHDHPDYVGPQVNLGIVYLHIDKDDEARAALDRALAIEPNHPAANLELGILLRRQGHFAEAEKAYRRALTGDPNYALAHYNLAVLLDVYLRRPDEALAHYEFYQNSLAEPDKTVAGWIIDLRRRIGNGDASRVAQDSNGGAPPVAQEGNGDTSRVAKEEGTQ
jgi:Flp pilus assembly protein TadD